MSANDENRNPTDRGTPSINTNLNPYYADGQNKDREQDSAYHSAGASSGSHFHSPQSTTSQGGSQPTAHSTSPRAGSQVPPSLHTVTEESTSLSSPLSGNNAQYTLSQSGTVGGDITPSPSEQHDTTSFGSQVTSALSDVMGALGLTQPSSPLTENEPQHTSSQNDTNQADLAPPGSNRHSIASDISHTSSYPSAQNDPEHPLSLNGVDDADFAPAIPDRQFEYSPVPAGLQNIRGQDMLHVDHDLGSGQSTGDSAPPVPPRSQGHTRQASVDECSSSSGESSCDRCDDLPRKKFMSTFEPKPIQACRNPPLILNGGRFWNPLTQRYEADVQRPITEEEPAVHLLPHERLDGGIGSSTRYSEAPPPERAVFGTASAASSYLDLTLREIRRDAPPSGLTGSAIEESPPSSPDGPSTHTTSTAEASAAANAHITISSPQRTDLPPLKTTNSYTLGQQPLRTPHPSVAVRPPLSDEEISPGAELSLNAALRQVRQNEGTSPTTLSPEQQNTDKFPSFDFDETPQDLLALRDGNPSASTATAAGEVVDMDQQETGDLARARTEPQTRVGRHEDPMSIRKTQSAGNSLRRKSTLKFDDEAIRKAERDEKWAKDMPKVRENTVNEAHGGKRKGSDVGMHKPLVKFARKQAAKVKELWLDTTTGKTHVQRTEAKAVEKARKISVEVHGTPAGKTRLASVTEIAKSPAKSVGRLSSRASRVFSRAPWERSAIDESTNDNASPAEADANQSEPRRFSSFTGSMRGSIGNLTSRMKPNFRRSRSEANVLGTTEENTMDIWRASQEVNRPRRAKQTDASPNLDVQIDSSRLVSPTTTRVSPFEVHPGCLTACLTVDGEPQCTHSRTVPIARTESERRNDPDNVPSMLDAMPVVPSSTPGNVPSMLDEMPDVPSLTPDNGTIDESETSSQVEVAYQAAQAAQAARRWIAE